MSANERRTARYSVAPRATKKPFSFVRDRLARAITILHGKKNSSGDGVEVNAVSAPSLCVRARNTPIFVAVGSARARTTAACESAKIDGKRARDGEKTATETGSWPHNNGGSTGRTGGQGGARRDETVLTEEKRAALGLSHVAGPSGNARWHEQRLAGKPPSP